MRCPVCATPAQKRASFEDFGANFQCFYICPNEDCDQFEVDLGPADYDGPTDAQMKSYLSKGGGEPGRASMKDAGRPTR